MICVVKGEEKGSEPVSIAMHGQGEEAVEESVVPVACNVMRQGRKERRMEGGEARVKNEGRPFTST